MLAMSTLVMTNTNNTPVITAVTTLTTTTTAVGLAANLSIRRGRCNSLGQNSDKAMDIYTDIFACVAIQAVYL